MDHFQHTENLSNFASRIDSKRNSKNQDFFVVATTGDMLENKPILKTEDSTVREMSCDLYSGLTSVESRTLERLNALVGKLAL